MYNTGATTPVGDAQIGKTQDDALNDAETTAIGAIVAAYAGRDEATIDSILDLTVRLSDHFMSQSVGSTHTETATVIPATPLEVEVPIPAIEIEKSVTQEKVYCLCCGRGFAMLKRHLKAEHGLSEEQYRARFNLPEDYPLVAPSYSERKAKYAKEIGLGKYAREKGEGDRPSTI